MSTDFLMPPLAPEGSWAHASAPCEHFVQFYENDAVLLRAVEAFVASGLASGAAAILIATRAHLDELERRWIEQGFDLDSARARAQYVPLEASETLGRLLLDGWPQSRRFDDLIAPVIEAALNRYPQVLAFGEMVGLLWQQGRHAAAIHLEELWNALAKRQPFTLFCAYPAVCGEAAPADALHRVCAEHARTIPGESYSALTSPKERLAAICELQNKAHRLQTEIRERKRMEFLLARREQQLTDFLENAAHPLHRVDGEGRILWANRAELELLGYAPDEYIGHHIAEFHADAEVIESILQRLLAGQTLHNQPARLRARDGSIRHVLIHSNALWEDGKFVSTRCLTQDVTAQKALDERLSERDVMLRLAMRSARMGSWALNLVDDTVQWSPELEALFGIERGSMKGVFGEFTELVHPNDRAAVSQGVRDAVAGNGDFQLVFRVRHASGEWRWLEARGQAMYDEAKRPLRLYGIAMDVSERVQAESTRALAAAIVAGSDDAILSKTLGGRITSWNAGAAHLFGWQAEEMIGQPILRIVPAELEQEELQLLAKLARGESIEHFETLRLGRDGRRIPVSLTISPVRDGSGNVIGISTMARDITARKRAEQALKDEAEALDTLYEVGKSVTAELDAERLAQRVTDAATKLSGASFGVFFYEVLNEAGERRSLCAVTGAAPEAYTRVSRKSAPYGALFQGASIIRSNDITQDARCESHSIPCGMMAGNLPVRSYLAVPVISRSGEIMGGLCFGHSTAGFFTARAERLVLGIASHAAIALDNARLYQAAQREIAQRMQAEASLREADRSKDEFLALLAHELRNPLATIRYAAGIDQRPGRSEEQRQQASEAIARQAGHMARLLDDLLDVSRITRGALELRKTHLELSAAICAAVETARPVIEAKQHTLNVDVPATPIHLEADAARIAQVFSNLLTNAAKYTDPGGEILLRVEARAEEVIVSVRDNGIGFSAEMKTRLFTMFAQAQAALERAQGGLGIGLALTRGLVRLHGGTISAHSEGPDRGSEFTVHLPISTAAVAESAPAAVDEPDIAGVTLRVLVADDNQDSAEMCGTLLQLSGHEVQIAHSGQRAFELAERHRPQVLFLDIGMPDVNGYELAARIRAAPWSEAMTLVAVTGWGKEQDRQRAFAAGFDHHLTKPVDPSVLASLLRTLGHRM